MKEKIIGRMAESITMYPSPALILFLIYFSPVICSSSLPFSPAKTSRSLSSCPDDQCHALLDFKNAFSINSTSASSEQCGVEYGSSSDFHPKTETTWKKGTCCCSWKGVTCTLHRVTGRPVISSLDLSCNQLLGTIPSSSSLFLLQNLQRLNLAHNYFEFSPIPSGFARLSSLIHLNLSNSRLSGPVPSEISQLSKLVSLDLSKNDQLSIGRQSFQMLMVSLKDLRDLHLGGVDLSLVTPVSLLNLSSSVRSIRLSNTGLKGTIPEDVFRFPHLQELSLSFNNDLTCSFPKSNWSSSPLRILDLSFTTFTGELPDSIGNVKSLEELDLSFCGFEGLIPASIGNLSQLSVLDLSFNGFSGQLPSSLSKLHQLTSLNFFDNELEGEVPDVFANLRKLSTLQLGNNHYTGKIPSWLFTLPSLVYVDLRNNRLTGPFDRFEPISSVNELYLEHNEIQGPVPEALFEFVTLTYLDLSYNNFSGFVESDLFSKLQNLEQLDLSSNRFLSMRSSNKVNYTLPYLTIFNFSSCGLTEFPTLWQSFPSLEMLDLSNNSMHGTVNLDSLLPLQNLILLDFSYNPHLSLEPHSESNSTLLPNLYYMYMTSCNISKFPNLLGALHSLTELDLSGNPMRGPIIKKETEGWRTLTYLDLSNNLLSGLDQHPWENVEILFLQSNLLEGPLPVPPPSTRAFIISKNKLNGEIPSMICDMSPLQVLDLSYNNLSGMVPDCLGNFSDNLTVVDLRMNNFHGIIPGTFSKGSSLRSLSLNGNQFEGPLPRALADCKKLEVLNLANNRISDTFPYWFETLPELQILVLRSNIFHGPIGLPKTSFCFPKLRVLDLSHNEFTGLLPTRYVECMKAMMGVDEEEQVKIRYMGSSFYDDSMIVTVKGSDIEFHRIQTIFTTIDMSSNKFRGKIPEPVGKLGALHVLNFSHNSLTGHIPSSLGNLTALESLDLSSNKLSGQIPWQLSNLQSLSVLNLSENQLVGPIPQGKQFNTFQTDSYRNNLGLCGFPLSVKCDTTDKTSEPPSPLVHQEDGDSGGEFEWKAVAMGYGSGLVIGVSIAYIVFSTRKPGRLVKLIEGGRGEKRRNVMRSRNRRLEQIRSNRSMQRRN